MCYRFWKFAKRFKLKNGIYRKGKIVIKKIFKELLILEKNIGNSNSFLRFFLLIFSTWININDFSLGCLYITLWLLILKNLIVNLQILLQEDLWLKLMLIVKYEHVLQRINTWPLKLSMSTFVFTLQNLLKESLIYAQTCQLTLQNTENFWNFFKMKTFKKLNRDVWKFCRWLGV